MNTTDKEFTYDSEQLIDEDYHAMCLDENFSPGERCSQRLASSPTYTKVRTRSDLQDDEEIKPPCTSYPVKLTDNDIISERGQPKHPGTFRYRELVLKNKVAFDSAKSDDIRKKQILKIIEALKPGRFLKVIHNGNHIDFVGMDDVTIYRKVWNAMKDCDSRPAKIATALKKVKAKRSGTISSPPSSRGRKSCYANFKDDKGGTRKKRKVDKERKRSRRNVDTVEIVSSSDCLSKDKEQYMKEIDQLSAKSHHAGAHVTSAHIHHFIEQMVHRGGIRRQSKPEVDKDWFSPQRQHLIRMQLLKRCSLAPESLQTFFENFSQGLFKESYNYGSEL